jgi:N-acetylneuraminic acid mutarotase
MRVATWNLIGLALVASAATAGDGTWLPLAPLSLPRQETGAATIGGEVYVVGGLLAGNPLHATASVEIYDIASDEWRFGVNLPVALDHMAVAAVGGRLFVIGGYSADFQPRDTVWIFDPADSSWSPGEPVPSARGGAWAVTHAGRVFLFGGVDPGGAVTRTTFIYDPVADDWSQGMDMPTAREHLNAVAAGNFIYVIGGRAGASTGANERYDPAANQWATMAPMPTPRSAVAAAALGGMIYATGGEVPMLFAVNEAYDIAHNTWSTATPMAVPRHGVSAVSLGDRLFAPGGGTIQGLQPTAHVDAFQPSVVSVSEEPAAPRGAMLGLPAPNPCTGGTRVALTLVAPSHVRVVIADALGRTIRVLADEAKAAGTYPYAWDLRDGGGSHVPAGVYWLRLDGSSAPATRKIVVQSD